MDSQSQIVAAPEAVQEEKQPAAPFHKSRSLRAVLLEAWRLFALQYRGFMRRQWLPLVAKSLGGSLAAWGVAKAFFETLYPMLKLSDLFKIPVRELWGDIPLSTAVYGLLIVGAMLLAAGHLFWKGAIYACVAHCGATGKLDLSEKSARAEWRSVTAKLALFEIPSYLILLALTLALALLTWHTVWWVSLPSLALWACVAYVVVVARTIYMVSSSQPSFSKSYSRAVREGFRHFEAYFLPLLLTAICIGIVSIFLYQPYAVFLCAAKANAYGVIVGDNPVWMSAGSEALLYILLCAVPMFLFHFLRGVQIWTLALTYVSTETVAPDEEEEDESTDPDPITKQ